MTREQGSDDQGGRRGRRGLRRPAGYALAWLVAAVLAVTVGLVAVSSVGASIRGRGFLGSNEAIRVAELDEADDSDEGVATPDPDATVVRDTVSGDYGAFVVECRGEYAVGIEARPAPGWRTVSYEEGPDDDVDAVFARQSVSVELDVFCNRGRPTVETERKTLPDD